MADMPRRAKMEPAPVAWSAAAEMKAAVIDHLQATGWDVRQYAMQRGWIAPADVEASRDDSTLLVEVLGYPNRDDGERPSRQWLKAERSAAEALFAAMQLSVDASDCRVAVAIPEVNHYLRLIGTAMDVLRPDAINFLVVSSDGAVRSWADWSAYRAAIDEAAADAMQREIEAEFDAAAE